MNSLLVTGGAGFIGSALVRMLVTESAYDVVVVDKLTYAGNLDSLETVAGNPRFHFEQVDIGDGPRIARVLAHYRPVGVLHLAAESHVDRSIDGPAAFVQTNVLGTFELLQRTLGYWRALPAGQREAFRFLHVSTDEVFGSLTDAGRFTEATPYAPNSPYSASKAGSDHLVRAWHRTYGLPTITTNCSNNYGPYQFPEKLIPLTIQNAVAGGALPVYGNGTNVRDWLFVEDHARAIVAAFERGSPGMTYLVGGESERTNLEVVHAVCDLLDALVPDPTIGSRRALVRFVTDRPGHDHRYAIDASRARRELGWSPAESFESGLRRTIAWYLEHRDWCARVQSGAYRGERLGLGAGA